MIETLRLRMIGDGRTDERARRPDLPRGWRSFSVVQDDGETALVEVEAAQAVMADIRAREVT